MSIPLLYWHRRKKGTKRLSPSPFKSEQEFEQMVFDTPAILRDIYLFNRQVRGGGKHGIPDIIGIDSEGKVCIVEMKNVDVDAGVIPQLLEYAIWAETHPDSIRALWLEQKSRPVDLDINWDEYSVRVLVVAPSINRSALEYINKITYPIELIEISRWTEGKDSWLLVNKLEPFLSKRARPASGIKIYDQAEYERLYNAKSVPGFLKVCRVLQQFAVKSGWPVEGKFNRNYFGCKIGNYIVFGVKWLGTNTYALFFKVPEPFAKKTKVRGYKMLRYTELWHEAVFDVTAENLVLTRFKQFFRKAVEQRMD